LKGALPMNDQTTLVQKAEEIWQEIFQHVTDMDMWLAILLAIIKIVVILIVARVVVRIGIKLVEKVFSKRERHLIDIDERRLTTINKLVNNVIKYTVYFATILMVVAQLGYNPAPLLAGAGVLGLAIGFGAQNLVRDVITGFFIIFEDQFAVGDWISVGNYSGTVEEIGLRVTKIKSWTGEVHIIPNGNIKEVTNFSINNSVAVVDVGVAYEEDIQYVTQALEEIVQTRYSEIENIVAPPSVLGVQNLGSSDVMLRVTVECKPMTHWGVARQFRAIIKSEFDKREIKIPYPRIVMFQPQERPDGTVSKSV
jgi:small conductance mechanosensitive channel